jgi:hypothetical protein
VVRPRAASERARGPGTGACMGGAGRTTIYSGIGPFTSDATDAGHQEGTEGSMSVPTNTIRASVRRLAFSGARPLRIQLSGLRNDPTSGPKIGAGSPI